MKGIMDNVINKLGTIVVLIIAIPIAFKLLFVHLWTLIISGVLLLVGYTVLADYLKSRKSKEDIQPILDN